MLIEEEDPLELGSDEEGGEEAGIEDADADTEAADDAGDTETEVENDDEIEIKPEDEGALYKPLEGQVDAVLGDFELEALKSAKVNESSLHFLIEGEDLEFDVNSYASDVSRLIDNYETLLDIESAIYYRAAAILQKNYGEDISDAFKEIMQSRYGYDFGDVRIDPVKNQAPLALGSGGEGAGA